MTTGLTPFLTKVATTPPDVCAQWLPRAQAIADEHGLRVEWVRFYLEARL